MMPSKAMYELCVGKLYVIEPRDRLGDYVEGEKGCYKGPGLYRAPGYYEGLGVTLSYITNWRFAIESVYNFATFEQSFFVNGTTGYPFIPPGVGISDFIFGASVDQYFGAVLGFTTERGILRDYPGPALTAFLGASVGPDPLLTDLIGPSIGGGIVGFISPIDIRIRGIGVYLSAGLGIDVLQPYLDTGVGLIGMIPQSRDPISYKHCCKNNKIQKSRLFFDILYGNNSQWITDFDSGARFAAGGTRAQFAAMALRYAWTYEDIMSDYENK
jgi:hypothetical protein